MTQIELVRPERRFAPGVLAYSQDPAFYRYLESAPMQSLHEAECFVEGLRRQNDSGERDYFLIVDSRSGEAIGTIGFIFYYARHHRVADLGYGLSRAYWGSGAFQAACEKVLSYGFDTLGLARVQVTTRADNARAVLGVEKVGFRREATLHSFYEIEHGRGDGILLYLLRDDFARWPRG